MKVLEVNPTWSGSPLDEFLAAHWPTVAKGQLREMVRAGVIQIDGMRALPSDKIRDGQVVLVEEEPTTKKVVSKQAAIEILYQDEHLIAVNKPTGIPVEPSRWGEHPEYLSAALLQWAQERQGEDEAMVARPRGLHRLDLGTSGVVLYALTLEAERYYRTLFQNREIEKKYLALVIGEVHEEGEIDAPLGPDRQVNGRMCVDRHGKDSLTHYHPSEIYRGFSLVEAYPQTGRTHQIRVHLASIGHPLAIDPMYGGNEALLLSQLKRGYRPKPGKVERPLMSRLTLHASRLRFVPFGQEEPLVIEAPLPKDFEVALRQLRKWRRPRRD